MPTVTAATDLVRKIEGLIARNRSDLERLRLAKPGASLAAARAKTARPALAALNDQIGAAEREGADLVIALEEARLELAAAERERQVVKDAELADVLEERLTELHAARCRVDAAMVEFRQALEAHHAVEWELRGALPRSPDLAHLAYGIGDGPLPVRLALRHHGLVAALGLPDGAGAGQPLASLTPSAVANYAASLRRRSLPRAA